MTVTAPTAEEARAWREYLAMTRGAGEGEYAATERLAWRRLRNQLASLKDQAEAAAMDDDFNALD